MAITTVFICKACIYKACHLTSFYVFTFLSSKAYRSVLPRCSYSSTSLQHCPGISYRDVDVIYAERTISGSSVLDHHSLHAKNGFPVLYFADL
jgi:hypothetical protein